MQQTRPATDTAELHQSLRQGVRDLCRGFPDAYCPAESPLSEFDLAQAEPEPANETAGSLTAQPSEQGGEGEGGSQGAQPPSSTPPSG